MLTDLALECLPNMRYLLAAVAFLVPLAEMRMLNAELAICNGLCTNSRLRPRDFVDRVVGLMRVGAGLKTSICQTCVLCF